ncbi:hypothetical protein CALCODRAFT_496504 [Calocera cornea HHB12733]|uniref:Secreted protein n=1 Tax=Calocera cornea HHB12733 TaxID=1353952 RepID=A0A165FTT9_9BASI|nr:hypothetical protein CALCODRAFT_496504 [Calocera cornea HHB12733]
MHFLPLLLALSTLSLSLSPAAAAGPPPRQKCLFICPASDLNGTPSDHSLEVGHRLDCGYLDEGVCAYDLVRPPLLSPHCALRRREEC